MRTSLSMTTQVLPGGRVSILTLVGSCTGHDGLYTMFVRTIRELFPPFIVDCTSADIDAEWQQRLMEVVRHPRGNSGSVIVCGLVSQDPWLDAHYVATRAGAEARFHAREVRVVLSGIVTMNMAEAQQDILKVLTPDLANATSCVVDFGNVQHVRRDALAMLVTLSDSCRRLGIPLTFHGMSRDVRTALAPADAQLMYCATGACVRLHTVCAEKETTMIKTDVRRMRKGDNARILRVSGDMVSDEDLVRFATIAQHAALGVARVVLDLRELGTTHSGFIGKIVALYETCKQEGTDLVIYGVSERLQHAFAVLRLDKVFTIVQTEDEALAL